MRSGVRARHRRQPAPAFDAARARGSLSLPGNPMTAGTGRARDATSAQAALLQIGAARTDD